MMENTLVEIYVETNRDVYRDLFPTTEAERVFEAANDDAKIVPLVEKLILNWRATAYLATMPGCYVAGSKDAVNLDIIRSDGHLLSVSESILQMLRQRVPEVCADPELVEKIQLACLEAGVAYRSIVESISTEDLEEEYWQTMLKEKSFGLYIWYSQRSCYTFAVNAFEHFLVGLAQLRYLCERVRADRELTQRLRMAIGTEAERLCWSGNAAIIRREVRHSIVHQSGEATDKLAKQDHGIKLIEEVLQITISDNKRLFKDLIACAIVACESFIANQSASALTSDL